MRPTVFLPTLAAAAVLAACSDYNTPIDPGPTPPAATTFLAVGDSTTVAAKLAEFRTALGGVLNAPNTPPQSTGRREINWDGVPAAVTNVDTFPAFFFNVNSKRGAVFTTPGTGLRVDSTDFATINPTLAGQFKFFSSKKTFMPVGNQRVDVLFQLVGTPTPAVVKGFGVIFLDVDREGSTRVEFFDAAGSRIADITAPARSGAREFSFVGASFATAVVARVRITSGQAPITATSSDVSSGGSTDLVIMDDFVLGEPQPSPQ